MNILILEKLVLLNQSQKHVDKVVVIMVHAEMAYVSAIKDSGDINANYNLIIDWIDEAIIWINNLTLYY